MAKSYTESVGEKMDNFSPDGRNSLNKKNTVCNTCGKKSNIHKDHIWPLAKAEPTGQKIFSFFVMIVIYLNQPQFHWVISIK